MKVVTLRVVIDESADETEKVLGYIEDYIVSEMNCRVFVGEEDRRDTLSDEKYERILRASESLKDYEEVETFVQAMLRGKSEELIRVVTNMADVRRDSVQEVE